MYTQNILHATKGKSLRLLFFPMALATYLALSLAVPAGCSETGKPLDADTRKRIDSLAAAGIGLARHRIDSACKTDRLTLIPRMIDSIRKEREQEIAEKLRGIVK